jgi:adenylyl-sulfate kinase
MNPLEIGHDLAQRLQATAAERLRRAGRQGRVLWLTGLSGSGKSTLATLLEWELVSQGRPACVLDGDNIRHGLCSDLTFSPADRKENIRRVGEVSKLFAEAGIVCISAFISPYRADRQLVRQITRPGQFIEVFVNAPLEICEQRDPKGLYAKARRGEIKEFTGVSSPYEFPEKPEIEIRSDQISIPESVAKILNFLAATEAAAVTGEIK